MKILNDPMIAKLVETFDLETPEQLVLNVSNYEFIDGKIIINSIEVLDSNLKFIKFADLQKVTPHLNKYYTTFGNRTADTNKTNQAT
jgi:hypothetical protein